MVFLKSFGALELHPQVSQTHVIPDSAVLLMASLRCAVFVGEVDEGKVSGFHNWIQFHFEERAGRVNYLGYLLPRGR